MFLDIIISLFSRKASANQRNFFIHGDNEENVAIDEDMIVDEDDDRNAEKKNVKIDRVQKVIAERSLGFLFLTKFLKSHYFIT